MDQEYLKKRALELWSEGVRFHMQGDLEKAVELYTQSIEIQPTAEAFTFRGWAYSFMNRTDQAIEECMKAIEIDPGYGNPYNDIGSYLLQKGKTDEAVEWFEKAKSAPRYEPRHFPYMNLGRLYAAKGLINKAIHEFEEAVRLQPNDPACVKTLRQLKASLN